MRMRMCAGSCRDPSGSGGEPRTHLNSSEMECRFCGSAREQLSIRAAAVSGAAGPDFRHLASTCHVASGSRSPSPGKNLAGACGIDPGGRRARSSSGRPPGDAARTCSRRWVRAKRSGENWLSRTSGMRHVRVPTRVVSCRARVPFRYPWRFVVRSYGPAWSSAFV